MDGFESNDGVILIAALPRPHAFVAKRELAAQRVAGSYLRRIGAVFVERFETGRAVEDARALAAPLARGVPLLAICRGIQELNVALGGTLFQLGQAVPGRDDHRSQGETLDERYAPRHAVAQDGLLRRKLGQAEAQVNSLHKQGIRQLAPGLAVEATAPDGLVEAFRVRDAKAFALAVQWHPEWKFRDNPLSMALLTEFGKACNARRLSRS
jgi:putative glutamine amidotransferase